MKIQPKCARVFLLVIGLFVLGALLVGSGTAWVTFAGVDLGYSNAPGASIITKAPGGFFYWFEGFAAREYKPREFGLGYDHLGGFQEKASIDTPEIRSRFGGRVTVVVVPFWVLFIFVLGVSALFLRLTNRKKRRCAQNS